MIQLSDIQAALERIRADIRVSPCTHSETFSGLTNNSIFLKLDNQQRTGALLVIEFEKDRVVGETGKCFRVRARRNANVGTNSFESRLDIGKLDHDAGAVILLRCVLAPLHPSLDWVGMAMIRRLFVVRWKPKERQGGPPALSDRCRRRRRLCGLRRWPRPRAIGRGAYRPPRILRGRTTCSSRSEERR